MKIKLMSGSWRGEMESDTLPRVGESIFMPSMRMVVIEVFHVQEQGAPPTAPYMPMLILREHVA